ncbi:hypothetical protein [Planococcus glaciei]|nr:hypothetical protein [Planococcus glaciei]
MSMLVFGILFLMAVKLPLVGSLITMAIALVAGLVLARFMLAKTKPDTSADTVSFR